MRGSSRIVGLVLVLLVTVSACAGNGSSMQSTTSRPADTVVLGVQSEPDTLNPILGYAPDGASKLFDGLVTRDAKLNLIPALAEALPTVDDSGRTYTFKLRDGVKFHDGQPLVADDVVFPTKRSSTRLRTRRCAATST
jgi:peptide/nickel transport system substrate-binding protein